jgi:hypothetical protein
VILEARDDMTTTLTIPDLGKLIPEAEHLCHDIASTVITTPEQYVDMQQAGNTCAALLKEIKAQCKPMVESTKVAYEAAKAFRDQHTQPLEVAKETAARKTGDWKVAQDRLREIAEAAAREAAQKAAEQAQLEQAVALEQAGHDRLADAILDTPATVPDVRLPRTGAPPVTGAAVVTYWKARLACGHEFGSLLPCCVANIALIPREYMEPAASRIGAYGRQWQDAAQIAGVEFYTINQTRYSGRGV